MDGQARRAARPAILVAAACSVLCLLVPRPAYAAPTPAPTPTASATSGLGVTVPDGGLAPVTSDSAPGSVPAGAVGPLAIQINNETTAVALLGEQVNSLDEQIDAAHQTSVSTAPRLEHRPDGVGQGAAGRRRRGRPGVPERGRAGRDRRVQPGSERARRARPRTGRRPVGRPTRPGRAVPRGRKGRHRRAAGVRRVPLGPDHRAGPDQPAGHPGHRAEPAADRAAGPEGPQHRRGRRGRRAAHTPGRGPGRPVRGRQQCPRHGGQPEGAGRR